MTVTLMKLCNRLPLYFFSATHLLAWDRVSNRGCRIEMSFGFSGYRYLIPILTTPMS